MEAGRPKALVTGASAGIGKEAAAALARAGYAVTAAARRRELVEELAAALRAEGHAAEALALDVADLGAARTAVQEAGPFAALINNAGIIGPLAPLAEADPDEFARCLAVNLAGAWNMAAAVLPGMAAAGGGAIINLSSGAADAPVEGLAAYCASKAGLAMLTRAVDLEHGEAGVFCCGLRPGMAATAMQDEIRASGVDNRIARVAKDQLLDPGIAARAAVYLVKERPTRWRGAEPDVRDPQFQQDAGL
ncbi:MAG: SDR family NAD(P)-dependent oxidoreductase [Betaproteobacteria bacterium AqS2]|uniref:SDR family NAD(P)-dependent oxidoreductase n=1 Tax=Candidatus Amphirhobacter heronislandensis TaxID=1732024 RepID=A0A930Y2K1_9GAMM|nr:SDR family NAD(P)-dependent oxidoreductase [Betaproteobacteria bacterium AqS2]